MNDLAARLQKLGYPVGPEGLCVLGDIGDGPFVSHWDESLGPQPTEEELLAVDMRSLKPRDQLQEDYETLAVGLSEQNRNSLWAALYRFSLTKPLSVAAFDALAASEEGRAELAWQLGIIGLNDDYADKIIDAAERNPVGFAQIVQQFNPSYDPYEGE